MVWPILISVAVTPRMSVANEAAGQASRASAPRTPSLVTKRIDPPPLFIVGRSNGGRDRRGLARARVVIETWHDAGIDANHNPYATDAASHATAQIKNAALPPRFRFKPADLQACGCGSSPGSGSGRGRGLPAGGTAEVRGVVGSSTDSRFGFLPLSRS